MIEQSRSCHMVLMFCVQKELVREIYVVPEYLKVTTN